jgi:hypothetical protein
MRNIYNCVVQTVQRILKRPVFGNMRQFTPLGWHSKCDFLSCKLIKNCEWNDVCAYGRK